MATKVCTKCGLEKDIEEFPRRGDYLHRRQSYCIGCRSKMGKAWYERNKDYQKANARKHTTEYRDAIRDYLHKYLLSHPCESCGETDPVVLEFHHTGEKDMAIAEMVTRITNIERLEEELRKTQVLCANCHRRVTSKERGWWRSRK